MHFRTRTFLATCIALTAGFSLNSCGIMEDAGEDDGRLAFSRLVKEPATTQSLEKLPAIDTLVSVCRSLAALDLIYEDRLHKEASGNLEFHQPWAKKEGEKAFLIDWEGHDNLVVWFSPHGCVIKGHDEESTMNPQVAPYELETQHGMKLYPGLLKGFPEEFRSFLSEPNFQTSNATFVIWRKKDDDRWHIGPIVWPTRKPNRWTTHDGSDDLLSPLSADSKIYAEWIQKSRQKKVDAATIQRVFAHEPMTKELYKALNSDRNYTHLENDLKEIGYPVGKVTTEKTTPVESVMPSKAEATTVNPKKTAPDIKTLPVVPATENAEPHKEKP